MHRAKCVLCEFDVHAACCIINNTRQTAKDAIVSRCVNTLRLIFSAHSIFEQHLDAHNKITHAEKKSTSLLENQTNRPELHFSTWFVGRADLLLPEVFFG